MIPTDPALAFALTLKKWFASNGWPQKITDDWAKSVGNSTGPWASQVCNAMKASGYNPKAEFFLALGTFNRVVAEQDVKDVIDRRLKDRLTDAKPLCLENGQPYGGAEFWSLYAGLIDPPSEFAGKAEFTEEDAAEWTRLMRDNFRQVSLKHMCSRAEAWEMVKEELVKAGDAAGEWLSGDDIQWGQEVLAGLHEPTADELMRLAKRTEKSRPLVTAFQALLGPDASKKTLLYVSEKRQL